MERAFRSVSIRDNLHPRMTELYDVAVLVFDSKGVAPLVSGEIDNRGRITEVVFTDVPAKVMSELFLYTEKFKREIKCGYSLEYSLARDSEEIRRTFRIQKDPGR